MPKKGRSGLCLPRRRSVPPTGRRDPRGRCAAEPWPHAWPPPAGRSRTSASSRFAQNCGLYLSIYLSVCVYIYILYIYIYIYYIYIYIIYARLGMLQIAEGASGAPAGHTAMTCSGESRAPSHASGLFPPEPELGVFGVFGLVSSTSSSNTLAHQLGVRSQNLRRRSRNTRAPDSSSPCCPSQCSLGFPRFELHSGTLPQAVAVPQC